MNVYRHTLARPRSTICSTQFTSGRSLAWHALTPCRLIRKREQLPDIFYLPDGCRGDTITRMFKLIFGPDAQPVSLADSCCPLQIPFHG